MGRPRGGTVSSSSDAASDAKSKNNIRTSTRERKELVTTYVEDSHSESEPEEREDDPGSDFEQSLSESVSEGESSGSEYGVKKKAKAKVSPKKGGRGGGRGKKASPRGKAKAAPKARGRPGRKPKAGASPAKKSDRPQRSANKRMKYRERSDSEEEESAEFTDSEVEEVVESESEEPQESGSDSGKRGRKRKAPQEKPKGRAAKASPKKVASPAKNGSNKKEEESDDEDMDVADEKPKETKEDVTASSEEEEKPAGEVSKSIPPEKDASVKEDGDSKKAEDVKVESPKATKPDDEKMLKNPVETDYKSFSFACDKKNSKGEPWNFKISCWNVGGIRSWVKKNGFEYLKREDPDVMCIQEVKSSESTQPPEVKNIENYPHTYWSYAETPGHYGVGLISKVKPEKVTYGLPVKADDPEKDTELKELFNSEGRLITAEYEKFFLINVYVPNGGRAVKEGDNSKPYPVRVTNGERLEWDRFLREHIIELQTKKPVIVAGDMNVAHEEIDLTNPKTNQNNAGFTKEEREDFTKLLEEAKLIDTFRVLYPDKKDAYSFWSYKFDARKKNIGWRLDYFLMSEKFKDSLVENTMRSKVLGSDHCPIVLFLHI